MTLYRALYGERGSGCARPPCSAVDVEIDGTSRLRFAKLEENIRAPIVSFCFPQPRCNRPRVNPMFLRQHAFRQARRRVVGQHRHHRLRQDGPVVEFGRHLVHREPGHLAARLDGALVRVQPGKAGSSDGWMLSSRPA